MFLRNMLIGFIKHQKPSLSLFSKYTIKKLEIAITMTDFLKPFNRFFMIIMAAKYNKIFAISSNRKINTLSKSYLFLDYTIITSKYNTVVLYLSICLRSFIQY
ncbi:hypothetical protein EDEG_00337 [Edhazardia aedis USNM 41457]|uniref:Uncharacterized protein n=1 Tax=Edhazardia aedis (strain USNM 41457) TaxID=1003232 RepID=J9DGW7_EDHAE|nr:hypothetical protein EDEG_00337 [Edhazardia aedis USNM 41457]|eukprot:EJW01850.1 hypothetical protein EDEG_00337 [Edhazardia aedis USNM 41457]